MSQCTCGEKSTVFRGLFSFHLDEAKPVFQRLHNTFQAPWLPLQISSSFFSPHIFQGSNVGPNAYKAKALPADQTPSPILTLYLKKKKICSHLKNTEIKVSCVGGFAVNSFHLANGSI